MSAGQVIRRVAAIGALLWALGFVWFSIVLPQPADADTRTDAVIVPTGGSGRIARGLDLLRADTTQALFVAGVDREVRPPEFAASFGVEESLMECCVTLDFRSVDTKSNALEAAKWLKEKDYKSVRLVTSDWHIRRSALDLERATDGTVVILEDAVPSDPDLAMLFLEYHKLLARRVAGLWE
ncbi:YdcF family protein [Pseudoblastomonas halimionae]|uniref:YdcF family protein n=1 Tax=Alteriqipengyuania halimionae TaxID=1926630 RepID=UPI002D802360|nr:YdcF family protein [Alteriqipengyuania halimionae]